MICCNISSKRDIELAAAGDDQLGQAQASAAQPACCRTRNTNSRCLVFMTHVVYLRVLRIYNGSGMSNKGAKRLALAHR